MPCPSLPRHSLDQVNRARIRLRILRELIGQYWILLEWGQDSRRGGEDRSKSKTPLLMFYLS